MMMIISFDSIFQFKINFIKLFTGEELWLKERPQWVKDKNEHI